MYSSCLTSSILFHWSPVLIILYHVYSLLDITYYLSVCSCLPVLTIWFSIHAPSIWIYRYTMLIPARHLAFTTPLLGEFLTPLDPHVQIPELGAC